MNLNYNHIRGTGGTLIFTAVEENQCLEELNLGWNSLGGQRHSSAAAFASCVLKNENLKHLDISYNRYTYEEIAEVAEGLNYNRTILGIHVEGN